LLECLKHPEKLLEIVTHEKLASNRSQSES
jgi:hypothetical protein